MARWRELSQLSGLTAAHRSRRPGLHDLVLVFCRSGNRFLRSRLCKLVRIRARFRAARVSKRFREFFNSILGPALLLELERGRIL